MNLDYSTYKQFGPECPKLLQLCKHVCGDATMEQIGNVLEHAKTHEDCRIRLEQVRAFEAAFPFEQIERKDPDVLYSKLQQNHPELLQEFDAASN